MTCSYVTCPVLSSREDHKTERGGSFVPFLASTNNGPDARNQLLDDDDTEARHALIISLLRYASSPEC